MPLKELVAQARSFRRFQESEPVPMQLLVDAVDAARLVPSGGNLQPLRFVASTSDDMNNAIFPHLGWAALLKDWPGPPEGERPRGYIVIAGDQSHPKSQQCDLGIAAQTVNLVLADAGFAACMLGNINARAIHGLLDLPDDLDVLLVIAIGKPGERVVLEALPADGRTAYWRDVDGLHHVPKRGLAQALLERFE